MNKDQLLLKAGLAGHLYMDFRYLFTHVEKQKKELKELRNRLISRRNKEVKFLEFSMKLSPDFNHDLILFKLYSEHKLYEPATTRLVQKILSPGMVFVDAGANNGYFSLLASRIVGATGKVYAFEPSEAAYNRLVLNIGLNKAYNIKAYKLALSDKTGYANLYQNSLDEGGHSLLRYDTSVSRKHERVKVEKLDNIIKGKCNLIKMDVEGFEKEVLQGSNKIIKNDCVELILEYNYHIIYKKGDKNDDIFQLLDSLGFMVKEISARGVIPKNIKSAKQLHSLGTNLYCHKH